MPDLYNKDYEKNLIGGILKYPEEYIHVDRLQSSDFSQFHATVWGVIRNIVENKGSPTPIIVAERLKALNINLEGIESAQYLQSLSDLPIDKKAIKEISKEIKKLSVIRNIFNNAVELQKEILKCKDKPAKEISKILDETLGNSISLLDSKEGEASNLYEKLESFIEDKGNNPQEKIGFATPFDLFNQYYGGLRKQQIYYVASRTGQGKSTFLSYIGDSVANECNPELNIKCLFLDSEMSEEDQLVRLAAARIGVPYYLIDTGLWRKDPEWFPKVRTALLKLRNENRNLYFKQISSMSTPDLINFVKRWYYRFVGKGNNCVIIYDYLKIMAQDRLNNQPEWLVALDKMQYLKDLVTEIDAPLFTALQVNRIGLTTNKASDTMIDDESVVSVSGRLDWLVAFSGILRRKTADEISFDGKDFGSHKMIPLKARYQGKLSTSHADLVKIMHNGKVQYKQNSLYYDIDNFKVEERGDFRNLANLKGLTQVKKEALKREEVSI